MDKVQILVIQEPPNTWKMLLNIPSVHPQAHLGPLFRSLPGAAFFSDQNSSLLWVQAFAQGRNRAQGTGSRMKVGAERLEDAQGVHGLPVYAELDPILSIIRK